MTLAILIFILILLILFSAFLSGTETSFFSLPLFTVRSFKSSNDYRKRLIANILKSPRQLLVTLLMLNILANILVQNTVSSIFGEFSGWLLKVGIPLVLTLIFGEVIPKSIALNNNLKISYLVVRFVRFLEKITGPFRNVLVKLCNYISRILFFFLKKEKKISPHELELILKTSKAKGVLHSDETYLAKGYLDLQEALVKELMRPKDEILFYNIDDPIEKLIHLLVEEQCTRVPVCEGSLDRVVGVISTRRLFFYRDNIKNNQDLKKILRKPLFVPESMNGWSLLQVLRSKNESIAMVVDEYGSINGLVTQEDLFESIVGEISDLRDKKARFTRSSEDVIIASGKMEISDFEELFNIELKNPNNLVTIGGWLIEQLEDIPKAGTKYITDKFLFYVLAADPSRVRRVYIRKIKDK
jgi:magnesium and cobalt exporter, CNNM family